MAIRDWFRSEATWREKVTELAARLAETRAAIERLRKEASSLVLDAGLGSAAAEQRMADIEREIGTLIARQGWQEQALAEAEAKAAAEEAAAEAERQRQAAEAHRRRIAELRASYDRAITAGEAKTAEATEAWAEAARIAGELADAIGTDHARRALGPLALAERLTVSLWSRLNGQWLLYQINQGSPTAKRSPGEVERDLVAGLLPDGDQART